MLKIKLGCWGSEHELPVNTRESVKLIRDSLNDLIENWDNGFSIKQGWVSRDNSGLESCSTEFKEIS